MWPFRRKDKKIGPPPTPELWDWDSALGVRLQSIIEEQRDAFKYAAESGASEICVSFEEVGSVTAKLRPLSDGGIHYDWGLWMPYDPDEGRRGHATPTDDPDSPLSLVMGTSPLEQKMRGFVFMLDDFGNSILLAPTRAVPSEHEVEKIKADPSVQKLPVGIGTRPNRYLYVVR